MALRLTEPDPKRVRIQITELAPGGKPVPGGSESIVVFGTTAVDVCTIIVSALRTAADAVEPLSGLHEPLAHVKP